MEWDLQTAHFFQYDDGMELVADDDGNFSPESVNIKLSEEVIKEINEVQKVYPNPCP